MAGVTAPGARHLGGRCPVGAVPHVVGWRRVSPLRSPPRRWRISIPGRAVPLGGGAPSVPPAPPPPGADPKTIPPRPPTAPVAPASLVELGARHLPERGTMPGVNGAIGPEEILTVVETEVVKALQEALGAIEARTGDEPPLPHVRYDDEDWRCERCGYENFASKSFRLCCGRCASPRSPLPARSAYMLTGDKGVGKSIALATVTHWARARGWLALLVPCGWRYVNAGFYVTPSTHFEAGFFEDPWSAKPVLEAFKKAHDAELLESTRLQTEAALQRWAPATTLLEFLDAALHEDRFEETSTAVYDLVEELAQCVTSPCLVAVDEFSAMFTRGVDHYWKLIQLAPDDLVGVDRLRSGVPPRDLADHEPLLMKRGVALYADTTARQHKLDTHFREILPHTPHEIKVTGYTDAEFKAAIDYYKDAGMVHRPEEITPNTIRNLKMVSQANPKVLFQRMLWM